MTRGSLLFTAGHRPRNEKSRNDYDEGISEWAPKTTSNSFQFPRISSRCDLFQPVRNKSSGLCNLKTITNDHTSQNALAFMRFPILFLCRMVSHTKIQFGFECDKNAGREIIIIVTTSFKKKSVLRCFPSTWKIKASVSKFLQFEAPFCGDGLVWTGGQTVKKDNLVLSTGLIMWIGHGKEIRKLHTVANSHSQPNW